MSRLKRLLFPQPARHFPGQRVYRITLRTAHLVSIALLTGSVLQGASAAALEPLYWATLASGGLYIVQELWSSTFYWLLQMKGLIVVLKLAMLGVAWERPAIALPVLVAAVVLGGISSHMPRRFRHYSPILGAEPSTRRTMAKDEITG